MKRTRTVNAVVLASAPDPGNAGHTVDLVTVPGVAGRFVWVRNGTAPHAPHLIRVEADALDPIEAVASTYGLTAAQYLTCTQRT